MAARFSHPQLRIHPLVIGIDHYEDSRIKTLRCAQRDALRVAQFLRSGNDAFICAPFRPFLGADATFARIENELHTLWTQTYLTANDMLLVYFAGHGYLDERSKPMRATLVCYSTDLRKPQRDSLRLDLLYDMMRNVSAATVMLIIDACTSGAIADPAIIDVHQDEMLANAFRLLVPQTAGPHRIILAAAHTGQAAIERATLTSNADGGGGVFTDTVLRGWRDGLAATTDSVITPESLASFLHQQFSENLRQKPVTSVTGGRYLRIGARDSGGASSNGQSGSNSPTLPIPPLPSRGVTIPRDIRTPFDAPLDLDPPLFGQQSKRRK